MQKKLIALAVAGLMSGAAFAQTSVTLGGKFDACYSFSRAQATENATNLLNNQQSPTKETMDGGCNTSSRVTIGAKETIAPGYEVRVDYDIRFGNVMEGKNSSTTGGLNSNDKKAMAFSTPAGTLQWGVANLESNNYHIAEKPYMVTPKDTELVKFGVSQWREESLSNRNTSYWTPVVKTGPVESLIKATYALGNQRGSGSNDAAAANSSDAMVLGLETRFFDGIVEFNADTTARKSTTSTGGIGGGSMNFQHYFVNVRPLPGNKNLKLSAGYNVYSGWNAVEAYKDKTTNFVVSYNFDGKAELGLGVSHNADLSSERNGGRSIMLGGSYFLSKSVQVYAALQKNAWNHYSGAETGGKYVGTGTNFTGNTNAKADSHTVKIGIAKDF